MNEQIRLYYLSTCFHSFLEESEDTKKSFQNQLTSSKRPNHEEDFFKFCVLLKKSELYRNIIAVLQRVHSLTRLTQRVK